MEESDLLAIYKENLDVFENVLKILGFEVKFYPKSEEVPTPFLVASNEHQEEVSPVVFQLGYYPQFTDEISSKNLQFLFQYNAEYTGNPIQLFEAINLLNENIPLGSFVLNFDGDAVVGFMFRYSMISSFSEVVTESFAKDFITLVMMYLQREVPMMLDLLEGEIDYAEFYSEYFED